MIHHLSLIKSLTCFFLINILNVFHQFFLPAKSHLHRLHHWQFHSKTQCAIACRSARDIVPRCRDDMYDIFIIVYHHLYSWYHYIKTESEHQKSLHQQKLNQLVPFFFCSNLKLFFFRSLPKPCLLRRNGPKPQQKPWLQRKKCKLVFVLKSVQQRKTEWMKIISYQS